MRPAGGGDDGFSAAAGAATWASDSCGECDRQSEREWGWESIEAGIPEFVAEWISCDASWRKAFGADWMGAAVSGRAGANGFQGRRARSASGIAGADL